MKTILLICAYMAAFTIVKGQTSNQAVTQTCIPMIGDKAPAFESQSTLGKIKFPEDYFGKWKIIFSHPADFTPVCSSELISLANMSKEFDELKTALIVLSTDGVSSHLEWVRSMESIVFKDKSTVKITFPLVSDVGLEISKKYGMIHPNFSSTKDIRAVFIIDNEDKIRAIFYYPSTTGRNMYEIKRTLIALQTVDDKYVLTPANWKPGDDVMIASPSTSAESQKMADKRDDNFYSLSWYMWYKRMSK